MNILETIIAHKKTEVERNKSAVSEETLKKYRFFPRKTLSLKDFLLDESKTGIIGEFKRRSPSKGVINESADVLQVTSAYADNGASALSILTDEYFFGGNNNDILNARINQLPILRKDFIIDTYQLIEAKAIGADIILLIAACLSPKQVRELAIYARSLNLEVLLEIHNHEELEHICEEVDIVGINNRNLKTFSVDINRSIELSTDVPKDKLIIAESGISDVNTIVHLKSVGFKGFLIGENFMKESDPAIAFASFVNQLKMVSV